MTYQQRLARRGHGLPRERHVVGHRVCRPRIVARPRKEAAIAARGGPLRGYSGPLRGLTSRAAHAAAPNHDVATTCGAATRHRVSDTRPKRFFYETQIVVRTPSPPPPTPQCYRVSVCIPRAAFPRCSGPRARYIRGRSAHASLAITPLPRVRIRHWCRPVADLRLHRADLFHALALPLGERVGLVAN